MHETLTATVLPSFWDLLPDSLATGAVMSRAEKGGGGGGEGPCAVAGACTTLLAAELAGLLGPAALEALAYQAALKARIASLLAQGQRVSSGSGGHVVIIREGARALGLDQELSTRLDRMRRTRHATFYDLDEVSAAMVKSALADTAAVVEAASAGRH